MSTFSYMCSVKATTKKREPSSCSDFLQLDIQESTSYALLTKDYKGSALLQQIAGLCPCPSQNTICFEKLVGRGKHISEYVQYVPDDIICYPDMTVEDYLCGIALATSVRVAKEAGKLCGLFEIALEEQLLDLTFEKNRLLAMAQSLVREPKLLLIDQLNDMLTRRSFLLLWKEIMKKKQCGMSVVATTSCFSDLAVPFDQYIFFNDEFSDPRIFGRDELPVPAKVITLEGMVGKEFTPGKGEVIYQDENMVRFLHRERDVKKITSMIYHSGCENFYVEELTMEETVFENFERWLP